MDLTRPRANFLAARAPQRAARLFCRVRFAARAPGGRAPPSARVCTRVPLAVSSTNDERVLFCSFLLCIARFAHCFLRGPSRLCARVPGAEGRRIVCARCLPCAEPYQRRP